MTLTLSAQIHILNTKIYHEDDSWWVTIVYSDGGEDDYGPFRTEEEAERFIY